MSELVERVARAIETALCLEAGRTPGAIWGHERGKQQVITSARAAIATVFDWAETVSFADGLIIPYVAEDGGPSGDDIAAAVIKRLRKEALDDRP